MWVVHRSVSCDENQNRSEKQIDPGAFICLPAPWTERERKFQRQTTQLRSYALWNTLSVMVLLRCNTRDRLITPHLQWEVSPQGRKLSRLFVIQRRHFIRLVYVMRPKIKALEMVDWTGVLLVATRHHT